jgi:outer membrane protein OmpA-like peptidoglycan-associated protein
MAEVENDELERKAAAPESRGVALADETPEELPALLAIAVGIAILVITLVWPSIRDRDTTHDAGPAEVAVEAEAEPEPEPEVEEEVVAEGPDIPRFESELAIAGLALSADGNTVIAEGVIPDEATRTQIIDYLSAQPNVDAVTDNLVVEAPPAAAAAVDVTAAQVSIVLEGTVPDEATRNELVARAVAVYSEEQVEDRLTVDAGVQPPVTVTIGGSMTDEVLFNQVSGAFDGMDGVEIERSITLEESSDLEASLNSLEPIQFASGSALVEPASEQILDQAAEFLAANPDVAIEIGGHTDSIGREESNEGLSQARAESVREALQARGVTNDMTAVGFGERRLKISPDENDAEAQQTNRRIEFRITG